MSTDDARVVAALARLQELDDLPVGEHPAVYDEVHRALQDVLAAPPGPDG
ncbi:MAG TPA: hypothetical protein VK908_08950 [Jiangellales bacterium]|jgi:hypothetical protein|nr:hypothetical protein [Jiangellales bacterium]